jgi:hypothetical protein
LEPKDLDRFMRKVKRRGDDECWPWMAAKTSSSNNSSTVLPYGQFHLHGKVQAAHRVSYMHFNGEIPRGMHVMHTCRDPSCVNPRHLRLGYPDERERVRDS